MQFEKDHVHFIKEHAVPALVRCIKMLPALEELRVKSHVACTQLFEQLSSIPLQTLSCPTGSFSLAIDSISNMHSLTALSLNSISTADISPLSSLKLLTSLTCTDYGGSQIPGLENVLANCKLLQQLHIPAPVQSWPACASLLQHLVIDDCEDLSGLHFAHRLKTLHIERLCLNEDDFSVREVDAASQIQHLAPYNFSISAIRVQGTFRPANCIMKDIARLRYLPSFPVLEMSKVRLVPGQMLQLHALPSLVKLRLDDVLLASTSLREAAIAGKGTPLLRVDCDANSLLASLSQGYPTRFVFKMLTEPLTCHNTLKLCVRTYNLEANEHQSYHTFIAGWMEAEIDTDVRKRVHFEEVTGCPCLEEVTESSSIESMDSGNDEESEVEGSDEVSKSDLENLIQTELLFAPEWWINLCDDRYVRGFGVFYLVVFISSFSFLSCKIQDLQKV
ncbi:hypothetical protein DUNSADRAFT_2834 [Dunaliella salina]|uniref:Encoded protein n=1 Tax=Dunaliella salina TaxID=3046 RepID=A0ABZ3LAJ2_DUNSA|nr:hypothetical protein DUNSADRAFT_2834 [Dunaliella salina]KAF5838441.1 hypothetical protein DUNSADRAFT_2834 [Dunaliella salina]|eukprot:KAF5838440.1 hypothetical protein DUNSADRAFT_2834 [Dunaliella salina]